MRTAPTIPNDPAIDISCVFSICGNAASPGVRRDLPYLKAEYERLDVIASAQSTWTAARDGLSILEENQRLHELICRESALFQWVVVDPYDRASFLQAEAMRSSPKVLGIRLPFSLRRRNIADYMDSLLAFAAEQRTTLMVLPVQLPQLVNIAEKYPGVNVIVPQLCTERIDKECFAEAISGLPNLYTDTSGNITTSNNSLEFVVETCGAEKVLFASGGESLAFEKARVLLSVLSPEEQQKILLGNALSLFPELAGWLNSRKEVLP